MNVRNIMCMVAATFVGSLVTISTATPAHSEQPVVIEGRPYFDPQTQRIVPYGDLDLVNLAGRNRLLDRVAYAVNDLCQMNQTRTGLVDRSMLRQCSKIAWVSAHPQIAAAFERATSGSSIAVAALTITSAP